MGMLAFQLGSLTFSVLRRISACVRERVGFDKYMDTPWKALAKIDKFFFIVKETAAFEFAEV
jgi:hypothetical protein